MSLAGEPGSDVGVLRKRGLPTHCWMCGMKMSMGIFSSQRSHISFPVSMISLVSASLLFPLTSCLARSSSSSFFTGSDFFLSLEAALGAMAGGGAGAARAILGSPGPAPA